MAALARTPIFPEATPLGALSAELRRPGPDPLCPLYVDSSRMRPRDYRGSGWIGFDPDALSEILRMANAIGNAAAQSSAMTQNARGPSAP